MRKLQIKDAEIMQLALQDEIMRSEDSRYDHRLHGIRVDVPDPRIVPKEISLHHPTGYDARFLHALLV